MKTWKVGTQQFKIAGRALQGPGNAGLFVVTIDEREIEVSATPMADGRLDIRMPDGRRVLASAVATPTSVWVSGVGTNIEAREVTRSAGGHEAQGSLEAPMPGKVVQIKVAVGDVVEKGATLLTVEAMKMEHALKAPKRGIVVAIPVAVGDLVTPGRALVTLGDAPE